MTQDAAARAQQDLARIRVVGDSHALFGFARVREAKIHWLGPVTMHRLGRDGCFEAVRHLDIPTGSVVVFCCGEIDVRRHLKRIADQRGTPVEDLIRDVAGRYLASLQRYREQAGAERVIALAAPPPARFYVPNPELEYGTLRDRVAVRRRLNEVLRAEAQSMDVEVLDFPTSLEARDGSLKAHLGDGNVHIAPACARPLCDALARLLGRELTFEAEPKPVQLAHSLLRRIPFKNRHAVLSALGPFPYAALQRPA